jgi:(2R)-ethylmalonyl-CoA mutase
MVPTIALAKAGGTTGEWSNALRDVFGEYRAPTGVRSGVASRGETFASLVERSKALQARRGTPPKLLVAKPGLDGHSNGAEQIAVAARDAGFEVVYQGIRLSPEEIVAAARDEDVDIVGISILSGSHLTLVPRVLEGLKAAGVEAKVIVGGIVPDKDGEALRRLGVAAIYTPKDFSLSAIMSDMLTLVEASS